MQCRGRGCTSKLLDGDEMGNGCHKLPACVNGSGGRDGRELDSEASVLLLQTQKDMTVKRKHTWRGKRSGSGWRLKKTIS